jgi:hypothetical protein
MNRTTKMLGMLIAAAALAAGAGLAVGQESPMSPAPPPGEIWVYPQGVFPNDFYALWLAVNGAPYASGDLPFPFYSVPDNEPAARPVFFGKPTDANWTVVLKAQRLDEVEDGLYVEGPFTAFNLGLAAGTEITNNDPVPPVMYLLATDQKRFSTGFGEVLLQRPVEIVGEMTPDGEERFFGYTPNFDPAASPDTNPAFDAKWLAESYPRGSEYDPDGGYGVTSTKSVVYGGYAAFHVYTVNVDLSVSDCLLYGQYGSGISINNGPNRTLVSNVDIRHTYHRHQLGAENTIGMYTWAINIQRQLGGGGKHLIEGCMIDQRPTWQEYYFRAHPSQHRYTVGSYPGGHAVTLYYLLKESPSDFVRIENSMFTNCGSNCVVYQQSNVDLSITNCVIDGGYFPCPATKYSAFADWRGNCIIVLLPLVDPWNKFPVIEIVQNELTARGLDAWGARLSGCGKGEVTVEDNTITCAGAGPGYAGGVQLNPSAGVGSNENTIARNVIEGTGGWAISVDAFDAPCERNVFIDNDLADFSAQEAGAVYFGPQANDNLFVGDVGDGIIDLGTGNVVE